MTETPFFVIARSASVLAMTVVTLAVGTRMLRLARRTRELPELAIGLHILILVIGYAAEFAGLEAGATVGGFWLRAGGNLCYAVATVSYLIFTYSVFRRGDRTAATAAVLLSAAVLVGWSAELATTEFRLESARFALPWFWIAFVPRLIATAWGAAEAFNHYSKMLRRQRLGLVDPLVTNRMLLWGVSGISGLMLYVVTAETILAGDPAGFLTGTPALLISVFGLSGTASIALAFLPPARYLRWLARSR